MMNDLEDMKARLKKLHLRGMAELLQAMVENGSITEQSAQKVLNSLITQEEQTRLNRKTKRLLNKADLFYPEASVAGLINDPQRKMNLSLLDSLLTCSFISAGQPVWLLGSSGAGKTYISCVLGKQACLLEYSVQYFTAYHFFRQCAEADTLGRLDKFMADISKKNLLILDDFLLTGVTFNYATYLFELLNLPADPRKPRTVIISTQLMEEEVKLRLKDASPALAEAIMGRLQYKSLTLEVTGKNMRQ